MLASWQQGDNPVDYNNSDKEVLVRLSSSVQKQMQNSKLFARRDGFFFLRRHAGKCFSSCGVNIAVIPVHYVANLADWIPLSLMVVLSSIHAARFFFLQPSSVFTHNCYSRFVLILPPLVFGECVLLWCLTLSSFFFISSIVG